MPAAKTNNTAPVNVYAKLLAVRNEFYAAGARKTGRNNHAEFMYFELDDIVPVAAPIFAKYGLLFMPTFKDDEAVAQIINTDKPDEVISFSIPLKFIAEPAKFRMNEVQGVGAVVTYYRRYLYMVVLDLVEADGFDGTSGATHAPEKPAPKKPVTPEQRTEIAKTVTRADGDADELQKTALKAALVKLKELDPSKEEFVQAVVLKTEKFTKITKSACEKLILNINEMISNYNVEEDSNGVE